MGPLRSKAWADLGAFLDLVEKGVCPSALEEAQTAARADPRKEKARLKRAAERDRVTELHDMSARCRLSDLGYAMRRAYQVERATARAAKLVAQKALAIKIVLELYNIMLSHPDGWTLMLGMPSGPLLKDIMALRDSHVMMESAVSAEVRRFQRAVVRRNSAVG